MHYPIEIIASVFRFFIGVVAISLVILFWGHVQRQEIMNDAVADFCEQVRYRGVITAEMYDEFLKKVSVEPVIVKMHHRRVDADNLTIIKTERDILKEIYPRDANGQPYAGQYKFKPENTQDPSGNNNGNPKKDIYDDFYVSVSPMQPSLFYQLLSVATQSAYEKSAEIAKGGMIYNNTN